MKRRKERIPSRIRIAGSPFVFSRGSNLIMEKVGRSSFSATLRLFKKLYALQDRSRLQSSLLSSRPFRFESILQRRLRRFVAVSSAPRRSVSRGTPRRGWSRERKKGSSVVLQLLFQEVPFPRREERLARSGGRVIYSKKNLRFPLPFSPHSRWIKRPVSRERHFAIIKKRREISLKKQSLLRTSRNSGEKAGELT